MTPIQHRFEAIGTYWEIELYQPVPETVQTKLWPKIEAEIAAFDQKYSRFRSDSWVSQSARQSGTFELPADAGPMLELYHQLYKATDGLFTPLVGSLLEEAGYDHEYSLQPGTLHTPLAWEEAIEITNHSLIVKQPVTLDLGAAGKGYLIDQVSLMIREVGVTSFCVDGSGDLRYEHAQAVPLKVGLEHPQRSDQVVGVVNLTCHSLCGSAGNRRQWAGFHHILNPKTLSSPHNVLAAWVVADSTMVADALATCLFLVDPTKLSSQYEFEYAIVDADMGLKASAAFPGEFF